MSKRLNLSYDGVTSPQTLGGGKLERDLSGLGDGSPPSGYRSGTPVGVLQGRSLPEAEAFSWRGDVANDLTVLF